MRKIDDVEKIILTVFIVMAISVVAGFVANTLNHSQQCHRRLRIAATPTDTILVANSGCNLP